MKLNLKVELCLKWFHVELEIGLAIEFWGGCCLGGEIEFVIEIGTELHLNGVNRFDG